VEAAGKTGTGGRSGRGLSDTGIAPPVLIRAVRCSGDSFYPNNGFFALQRRTQAIADGRASESTLSGADCWDNGLAV